MTNEELLEEAKRRYPVGCIIKSAYSGSEYVVSHKDTHMDCGNIDNSSCGYLLYNGKWAEIVSLSENKEIIPEYVELLPNFDSIFTGKIFNTKDKLPNSWNMYRSWEWLITDMHSEFFKPSTKEAFDNQNAPEYVECIKKDAGIEVDKIYQIQKEKGYDYNGFSVYYINNNPYYQSYFKPSTKEAFDAQNQPKSIEKWSVGSYVVFLEDNIGDNQYKKGEYQEIIEFDPYRFNDGCIKYKKGKENDLKWEKIGKIKWFATKSETEEFAKTLVEPVKELTEFPIEGFCRTNRKELRDYLFNKFPNCLNGKIWSSDFSIVAWNDKGYWYAKDKSTKSEYTFEQLEKFLAKTPLKQAKFKVGDKIKSNPGGWQFCESGLENEFADKHMLSDHNLETGKCTKVVYSQKHKCYWYKINNYGNMFTEDCISLVEPSKQAVHCKTQEEWDFVISKFNPLNLKSNHFDKYKSNSIIIFSNEMGGDYYGAYSNKNETMFKEILSFQEWCDLNGYKMEAKNSEIQFEVGKWYLFDWKCSIISKSKKVLLKVSKVLEKSIHTENRVYLNDNSIGQGIDGYAFEDMSNIKELSIEEIQQYLPDGHPDKIKSNQEFKVGDWVINLDKSINYKINEFCKISLIEDGYIACEGKPQEKYYRKSFKCFRHATPEEIKNYLLSVIPDPKLVIGINNWVNPYKINPCAEVSHEYPKLWDETIKLNYLTEPE